MATPFIVAPRVRRHSVLPALLFATRAFAHNAPQTPTPRTDGVQFAEGRAANQQTTPSRASDVQTPVTPAWADSAWRKESAARGLVRDSSVKPVTWSADFDGDGKTDIAWLVRHRTSRARGVLLAHASGRAAQQCGAGVMFGNGGDNFDWMDAWRVVPSRSGKGSALLVEKLESAGGRIEFRGGRYRWFQVGD